ncbi:MAG: hypothetical protein ACYTEO_13410 [Planctomycetota bacterium]|jgi:hypothetical protein
MQSHTVTNPWIKVRNAVSSTDTSSTDTPMTDAQKYWGNRDITTGVSLPLGASGAILTLMGDDEGSDATVTVWAYAERGPAEWVIGATFRGCIRPHGPVCRRQHP